MTSTTDDPQAHADNKNFLNRTSQFDQLPERVRTWVNDSPMASGQFAQFFRDGGAIKPEAAEPLASYRERTPPEIAINPSYYPLVNLSGKSTELQEARLFAMMAHEIGHHAINSRSHPFTGTTREENVQYRAEHEARTMLNAFKIFDELREKDPSYRPRYDSIGYGSDLQMAVTYQNWTKHRDEKATVSELAGIVLATRDSRTTQGLDNVPDYNGDGAVNNAERFRRDWDRSQELKNNGPRVPDAPAEPERPSESPAPDRRRRPDGLGMSDADGAYLAGIRDKTETAFVRSGIPRSASEIDSITACLAAQSKQAGLGQVDHVVVSRHADGAVGRNVFAVEGKLDDPACRRAHVVVAEAIATSPEVALKQFEAVSLNAIQRAVPAENLIHGQNERTPLRQM